MFRFTSFSFVFCSTGLHSAVRVRGDQNSRDRGDGRRTMINELCSMRWRIQIAALTAVLAVNYAPAFGQDIQYREDPNAEKRMTLLLTDWDPQPMLHVPTHVVPRAKFYVIDVYGMQLSDSILEKVYHSNVENIFAMHHGGKR
jgi:hypothetical protein